MVGVDVLVESRIGGKSGRGFKVACLRKAKAKPGSPTWVGQVRVQPRRFGIGIPTCPVHVSIQVCKRKICISTSQLEIEENQEFAYARYYSFVFSSLLSSGSCCRVSLKAFRPSNPLYPHQSYKKISMWYIILVLGVMIIRSKKKMGKKCSKRKEVLESVHSLTPGCASCSTR